MKKYVFTLLAVVFFSLAKCQGQTLTNWDALPELDTTPSDWPYAQTPGFYFWAGAGVSFTFSLFGLVWRQFKAIGSEDKPEVPGVTE